MTKAKTSRLRRLSIVIRGLHRSSIASVIWVTTSEAGSDSHRMHPPGHPLAESEHCKYLGVKLHGSKCIQSGVSRCLEALRIPLKTCVVSGMFAAVTAAAGLYGCEGLAHFQGASNKAELANCRANRPPCTSTAWVCPGPLPAFELLLVGPVPDASIAGPGSCTRLQQLG
jgi:hypothetical protein